MTRKFSICSVFCVIASMFLFAGCFGGDVKTFNISGKVVYNDTPIEGVTVVSDSAGETQTDEKGQFAFSGLMNATVLEFSADGYVFENSKVVIYKEVSNLIIKAEKTYMLTGRVVSNGVGVAGAKVEVKGLVNLSVTTDSQGNFEVEVAGQTQIKTTKDGFVFEDKIVTIDSPKVVISGTTNITATVIGLDDGVTPVLRVGEEEMLLANGVYTSQNVKLGSVITPILAGYHFEPTSHTVLMENEQISFTAYKLYTLSGTTVSGTTSVNGVDILVNGEKRATSNDLGEFSIQNLWGENIISYSHSILKFVNCKVDNTTSQITANGVFNVGGNIICDEQEIAGVRVALKRYLSNGNGGFEWTDIAEIKPVSTDENGDFAFNNVMLGDKLLFTTDDYKIEDYLIDDMSNIQIFAQKYFTATITVTENGAPLENAVITRENQADLLTDARGIVEITQCLDSFTVTVSKEGYTSKNITITAQNNQSSVILDKYFDLNIAVHSGEIILNSANVWVNNTLYALNENGSLLVENCLKTVTVEVLQDKYNAMTIVATKDNCNLDFNLSYTVTGTVRNGDLDVDATVTATNLASEETTINTQNGAFSMMLFGENIITVTASGLDYETKNVTCESNLAFTTSYAISGSVIADNKPVVGAQVILINSAGQQTFDILESNTTGEFSFSNLQGEYILQVANTGDVNLQPKSHKVTKGGTYNFDANGYSVKGTVTCGGEPLSGVTLRAGDFTATTGADGTYSFALIRGDVTIVASKTGYTFSCATGDTEYNITPDDNGKSFDFTATYMGKGTLMCGNQSVANALVEIGEKSVTTDENGYFEISGLSGNNAITITKTGFTFVCPANVSEYVNLNITATFEVSGTAKTGTNALSGVTISNGNVSAVTNENGEFTLAGLVFGDSLTATLKGYKFNTITDLAYGNVLEFSATFNVSGVVKSAGSTVEGVVVTFNDSQETTDSMGRFSFAGLNQFGTMTFTKAGYEFASETIDGPKDIEVKASFSVKGKITIGNQPLSDVKVSCGKFSAFSNSDGEYALSGLIAKGDLTVEKEGFDFKGDTYFVSATTLDFTATYFVKFSVASGNADMGDAVVTLTNSTMGKVENQSAKNSFIVRGLVGEYTFMVSANNFDAQEVTVNSYKDFNVTLTYKVTLKLNSALENVKIFYSDSLVTDKETSFEGTTAVLSELVGKGSWRVEKENYRFTPNSGTFSLSKTQEISFEIVYSVEGYVKTENGIGVYGMKMSFGNLSTTTTDENGYYKLTNLVGSGTIKGILEADNCTTIEKRVDGVDKTGTFNISLANNDYAYWMFEKGYQNLRDSEFGYKIEMTKGNVDAGVGGQQNAYGLKMRDKNGIYLMENKNYGGVKFGIDPRVSLTAICYADNNVIKKMIRGGDVTMSGSKVNTNYSSATFSGTTRSAFLTDYGIDVKGMYPYDIKKSTVKNYNSLSLTSTSTGYTTTFSIDTSALGNYTKQMNALSGQTPSFESVSVTYTFDKKGNLLKTQMAEKYKVSVATINADMEETITTFTEEQANLPENIIDRSNFGN